MKAAVVETFAAPPRYEDFADPTATGDEVLVTVTAAGLHPIVKALASGSHYSSTGALPFIPGVDGVGRLDDGTRVFFGAARSPYGTFAERAPAARRRCFSIPDALDDVTVAAMMNPGMSSWAALAERVHFTAGEAVLILGATGSAGQLAVQIAKRMGARHVVAVGRDPVALDETRALGADATISLGLEHDALVAALREEIAGNQIDVILDYLWGAPAEAALAAIAQKGPGQAAARIRYVQIGNSAGPTITLPAAILRSSGLEMLGSGFGSVSMERLFAALADFLQAATQSPFQIKATALPLRDVESLWNAPDRGARLVFAP
ncbi:MAG TPA: zinc-binding alcohol dehydrogenase family protein [Acidobacteriaceae bacterium]|jgi:NADPH2:quinone reductase|nr:zinc-binding alcohol dehydrogenase family protein [Acidobacteriaceae bacterium]